MNTKHLLGYTLIMIPLVIAGCTNYAMVSNSTGKGFWRGVVSGGTSYTKVATKGDIDNISLECTQSTECTYGVNVKEEEKTE